MTRTTLQALEAEMASLRDRKMTQMALRAAVFDAAEAAGCDPDDSLPPPLAGAYDAYTREIARLDAQIADIDQKLADERELQ